MKKVFYFIFLFSGWFCFSQNQDRDSISRPKQHIKEEADSTFSFKEDFNWDALFLDYTDSLSTDKIKLEEVEIIAPLKFDDPKERSAYLLLKRRTEKVWPYAVLAAERLEVLRERLDLLESNRDKRVYTRRVQKYMEDQFTDQIKDLTKSEGKILVKLLHRQTGETTFETIKDLRTGWRAFRYNVTAGFFTISLKEEFNPLENKEDYFIENILRRGIQAGYLEDQEPALKFDYSEIFRKWN